MSRRGRFLPAVAWLFLGGSIVACGERTVVLGKASPIRLDLPGAASVSFPLELARGDEVEISAIQGSNDVVLKLMDPAGVEVAVVDQADGAQGLELMLYTSAGAGLHRIELRTKPRPGPPTSSVLELEWQSSSGDPRRRAAHSLFLDAEKIMSSEDADRFERAEPLYQKAMEAWRELRDFRWQARISSMATLALLKRGKFQEAAESCTNGLVAARSAGDRRSEAELLGRCGWALDELGRGEESLADYRQAEEIYPELGDLLAGAQVANDLGVLLSGLGRYSQASESFRKAVELQEPFEDVRRASSLTGLGLSLEESGWPEKALEAYSQALPLRRAANSSYGEAATWNNLGKAHFSMGNLQEAIDSYQSALSCLAGNPGRASPSQLSALKALVLNNLGAAYRRLGDLRLALSTYRESLAIRAKLQDGPVRQATTRMNIGVVLLGLGRLDEALAEFREVEAIWLAADQKPSLAAVYENIGDGYLEKLRRGSRASEAGAWAKAARDAYGKGIRVCREIGSPRSLAGLLLGLGQVDFLTGDARGALEKLNQSIEEARRSRDSTGENDALTEIARVELRLGDLAQARTTAEAAIAITESGQGAITSNSLKNTFLESRADLYDIYVDTLMAVPGQLAQGDAAGNPRAAALEAKERAKTRRHSEILARTGVEIRGNLDENLARQERALRARIQGRQQFLTRQVTQGREASPELVADLRDLERRYEEVWSAIRIADPQFAAAVRPTSLNAEEIRKLAVAQNLTILEFGLGGEQAYSWVIDQQGIRSFFLGKSEPIRAAARRFASLLALSAADAASRGPALLAARALGQQLQEPLKEAAASRGKRILVVPDRELFHVPFAALFAEVTAQSLDELELIQSTSISAFEAHGRLLGDRRPAPKRVALFADPVFDSQDPRLGNRFQGFDRSAAEPAFPLLRLEGTRRIARVLEGLVPAADRLVAVDFDATRELAQAGVLRDFRILHFATHGIFDATEPKLSAIALTQVDRQGRSVDGFLTVFDVYQLRLAADLVVLSGCETALGEDSKLEGPLGLQAAFLFAGARQTLSTLWKVPDESTAELMEHFYQALLVDRLPPGKALSRSQARMAMSARYRHPVFWSGFVLSGS